MSWQAASRLLEGLRAESVVCRDEASKKYRLSIRVCGWASSAIQGRTPISLARKECARLALDIGRQISFMVLEDLDAVIVERCDISDGIPLSRFVPARRLWCDTAAGRVIVAFSSPDLRSSILARTYARVSEPLPPIEDLEAELDAIRIAGFAVTSDARPHVSVGAVVPVRDQTGRAIAAIHAPFPEGDVQSESGVRLLGRLKSCAMVISHFLGFEDAV